MEKRVWALYIGYIMISMNEIDWLTNIIQSKILKKEISKTWIKKTLSERLKSLLANIENKGPFHEKLKRLMQESLDLCEIRNLAAHGHFCLDAIDPMHEGEEQSKFLLISLTSEGPATQKEVEDATRKCIELSSDISRCIAEIQFYELD